MQGKTFMHLSIYCWLSIKTYYKNLAICIYNFSKSGKCGCLNVIETPLYWLKSHFRTGKKKCKNSPKNKSMNLLSFYKPQKWML